jgi:hypothetical protein
MLILFVAGGYLFSMTNNLSKVPLSSFNPASSSSPKPSHNLENTSSRVNIYMIALEDNGKTGKKIGCDDSVVPVRQDINKTDTPLKIAIEKLLSIKEQNIGREGFYNSLYQSDLEVENAVIDATGSATVSLKGSLSLGGVCDIPRFKSQLEETAMQFPSIKSLSVFINNQTLDEALSQR